MSVPLFVDVCVLYGDRRVFENVYSKDITIRLIVSHLLPASIDNPHTVTSLTSLISPDWCSRVVLFFLPPSLVAIGSLCNIEKCIHLIATVVCEGVGKVLMP